MKTLHHRARVAFEFERLKDAALAAFAEGLAGKLANNATFPSPPFKSADLSSQAAALRALLASIAAGNRSTELTAQKGAAKITLQLSLIADAHYVEDTANLAAAGDVQKAAQLIASTGFTLTKTTAPRRRTSGVVASGPGWIHARNETAGRGAVNLWRYGIAPAKGAPPQTLITLVTTESDVVIRDLASGTIVAVQHAIVLPVRRSKPGAPAGAADRGITPVPAAQSRYPVYSHMQSDPYTWSDFVYAVVP